jgi:topoisomerase IV subunit A
MTKGKLRCVRLRIIPLRMPRFSFILAPGVSPDRTLDALYAFTDCEVSISPNASIIDGDKPRFIGVSEILRVNTDNTVQLLKWELEIRLHELMQAWHFSTLEKIFIQEEMYIDFKHLRGSR